MSNTLWDFWVQVFFLRGDVLCKGGFETNSDPGQPGGAKPVSEYTKDTGKAGDV